MAKCKDCSRAGKPENRPVGKVWCTIKGMFLDGGKKRRVPKPDADGNVKVEGGEFCVYFNGAPVPEKKGYAKWFDKKMGVWRKGFVPMSAMVQRVLHAVPSAPVPPQPAAQPQVAAPVPLLTEGKEEEAVK